MEILAINLLTSAFVLELNRYPIKIKPSQALDFAGRLVNLHQLVAHFVAGLKYLSLWDAAIFGAEYEQNSLDFTIVTILDYIGFVAIFSRMSYPVPYALKTTANYHIATVLINLVDRNVFQRVYIHPTHMIWNLMRVSFVVWDMSLRFYFHFIIQINQGELPA